MILAFVLGCGAESPAESPLGAPASAPSAPAPAGSGTGAGAAGGATAEGPIHQEITLLGKVEGVKFVGDWTSPPCGGRTYARNLHFDADQHYAAIDLVEPCPPGTECVWSGMVGFQGLWALEGKVIKVREIGMVAAQAGGPHPVKFEATEDGKLVENGCFYTQGLTVPPGYTEERVRPEIVK